MSEYLEDLDRDSLIELVKAQDTIIAKYEGKYKRVIQILHDYGISEIVPKRFANVATITLSDGARMLHILKGGDEKNV